jgi:glutamate-5-semialdehyde dehydrogenase
LPSGSGVLKALVQALKARQDDILEANTLDLEASLEMAVPDLVIDWLRLTPDRLHNATTALERLQTLDIVATPSGHRRSTLPSGGEAMIQGSWQALGVVALVYEALPELAIFAAGLCLCTGNSLVLKGGNEASQTNQAIAQAFRAALADTDQPEALIQVISASDGEAARRWLMQTPNLDLVIPYGRPSLIQQVCREAYSPVLAPALGNCYLYWAASGDIQTVATAVIASHQGNPDPVNAVEKVLVDAQVSDAAIATLQQQLQAADLQVKVLSSEAVPPTDPELWQQAFLTRTVWLCPCQMWPPRSIGSIATAAAMAIPSSPTVIRKVGSLSRGSIAPRSMSMSRPAFCETPPRPARSPWAWPPSGVSFEAALPSTPFSPPKPLFMGDKKT